MTSDKVEIHHLNKNEIQDTFAKELFEVANAGFKGESPWSLNHIQHTLEAQNSLIIYATIEQRMIGFIIASETIDLVDIFIVVVAEEFKQRSIGTKLFEYLIDYSKTKEIEGIVLETRKSNKPAIKLYQRVGFQEIGVRKAYYSSPIEDAIVMRFEI